MFTFLSVHPTEEDNVLSPTERKSDIVNVRYSTVLCTGESKAGKTRFCNLLMNKTTQSPDGGDNHTIFVKKQGDNHGKACWTEINFETLINHIDSDSDDSVIKYTGTDKVLDILILLDINVPPSAICLLQPAIVTFVTYKLRGKEDDFCSETHQFIKEFMSSNCFVKNPRLLELLDETEKGSYTVFIGTIFSDKAKEAFVQEAAMVSENISNLKEHINCSLRVFPLELLFEENSDGFLHNVDLKNGEDDNVSKIKDFLDETLTEESLVHQIPASWVLLALYVQKMCLEKKVQFVDFKTVLEMAWRAKCKQHSEEELKRTLQFFHSQGVLFHFSTVEGASDYVFTRCCWIFDLLKDLFFGELMKSTRNDGAKQLLLKNGILNYKIIKEIERKNRGKIPFKTFINLLQHLKFIAPLKEDKSEYFFPSILQPCKSDQAFQLYGNIQHSALLITFLSGALHRSAFCFLSAFFIANPPDGWHPLYYTEQVKRQHTYKDMIAFSIGLKEYVCIIDKAFYLQIQIHTKSKQSDSKLNSNVFKEVKGALEHVCKDLCVPIERCKYGFPCNNDGCPSGEHVMVVDNLSKPQAHCSKSNEPVELQESHIVWFEVSV